MNNMWKLSNPVFTVSLSVLSGCVLLYTTSIALISVLIALIITVYACVSLLIDESLVTRHASILHAYLTTAGGYFYEFIKIITSQTSGYVYQLFQGFRDFYKERITDRMERHRRITYQLSSESLNSPRTPGELKILKGLSPIPKRGNARISESENNIYGIRKSEAYQSARASDKVTSTPMIPWKNREPHNGDIGGDSVVTQRYLKKTEVTQAIAGKNEEGNTWGTSISPKIRPKAAGVKAVQTVAGPLLASTRYNIDCKTYTDVTSPGLTSRLTKYATEANTKLLHSPYGMGQFPKVNLNSSPTPLINSRTGKMRLPVTVRIAPPDTRYSPPDRQRVISDICQEAPRPPRTVAQVLRDMSLKRHASTEDVGADLIKKQRTDGLYGDELENLEEMTQKRARDESSRSDEDISIDNASLRPVKRTKKPSCYDILNSLSSSTNVNSGVKRKADISRSGTPDLGKHFKSLETSQVVSESSRGVTDTQSVDKLINESTSSMANVSSPRNSLTGISPRSPGRQSSKQSPETHKIEEIFKEAKNSMIDVPAKVKLTDRLFMREEPQNIEKLKSLIEEHSSSPKFTKHDTEEIKKSDIINMRQTSVKAKLKSMFDAISGKTASTIDPSVVIQAEPITPTSPSRATLSSSTSTTNVNTSPISTSAIVPIIGKMKTMGTPGKHVTFNLPVPQVEKPEKNEEIQKSEGTGFSFGASVISSPSSAEKSQGQDSRLLPVPAQPTSASAATAASTTSSIQGLTFSLGASTPGAQTVSPISQSNEKVLQPASTVAAGAAGGPLGVSKVTALCSTSTITTSSTGSSSGSATSGNSLLTFTTAKSPPKVAGFTFGATSTSSTGGSHQLPTTSAPSSEFSFGSNSGAGASAFGTTAAVTSVAASTQSTFTFGANNTTPSTPSSGFSFGSTVAPVIPSGTSTPSQPPATTSLTFGIGTSASVPTFGTPSTTASTFGSLSTTASAFGVPSTTTPTFGAPSTTAPAFGAPSTTAPAFGTPSTSISTFGTTPTTTPSFGTPSAAAPAFGTPSTVPSAFGTLSTAAPAFGTSSTTTPAFGAPTTITAFGTPSTAVSATTPTFSALSTTTPAFGTPSNTTQTFGAPSTTTPAFGTPSTTTPAFGAPSTTTPAFGTPSNTTPAFGAPSTTTPAFGTPSNTTPAFGAPSTTTPAFGTPSTTTPAFGTPSTTTPAFGAPSTTTSTFGQSTSASLFGTQPSAFSSTSTTTALSFGAPKTIASTATSLFNGTSTTPSTSSSMFSGFGQSKPPPAFNATTTTAPGFAGSTTTSFGSSSLFSGQPTTTTGFVVNNPTTTAFGQASSGFGATTAAPAFGASGFGGQSTTSSFTGTPAFGAATTAPPAFPTGTTSTGFGTSTSGFGTSTTAPPAFGNANSSFTGFGAPTTSSTAAVSPFGGANSGFGGTGPSTGSTGGFSFGASAGTPATTQATQSGIFSFGASSNSTGFQFNGNTAPQTGAFNFSGSATPTSLSVPSFSPAPGFSSGGNMFSIGSGSVAPRSRATRQGRRHR
ncbi:nuclear pore complex protein DDB_G0274915 homolog [Fopius arisanus]|uniref:Nuclear pore complex protein DDB_G0274915 homolog n=2 Tax=Fopius arisanus TaxID=64838 RepID=A0A9R1U4R5_9HYME|nr:PREDICTED: nuclear pore complex protein DDB_G0274915 homolog [Fopius arisanus]